MFSMVVRMALPIIPLLMVVGAVQSTCYGQGGVQAENSPAATLELGLTAMVRGESERARTLFLSLLDSGGESADIGRLRLIQLELQKPVDQISRKSINDWVLTIEDPELQQRGWFVAIAGSSLTGADAISEEMAYRFIEQFPRADYADDILFFRMLVHYRQSEYGRSEAIGLKILHGYPRADRVPDAIYFLARIALTRGEYYRPGLGYGYLHYFIRHKDEAPFRTSIWRGSVEQKYSQYLH